MILLLESTTTNNTTTNRTLNKILLPFCSLILLPSIYIVLKWGKINEYSHLPGMFGSEINCLITFIREEWNRKGTRVRQRGKRHFSSGFFPLLFSSSFSLYVLAYTELKHLCFHYDFEHAWTEHIGGLKENTIINYSLRHYFISNSIYFNSFAFCMFLSLWLQ